MAEILSTHLEAGADLEDGADDREGDETDEGENGHQHAARDHLGEHAELVGNQFLVGRRHLFEARHDIAGVLADGEAVEHEVGETAGARERD